MNLRTAGIRMGLEALYFSGAFKLLGPLSSGIGAVFTMHHVRPARNDAFQPNALLEIDPEFLETLIEYLRYKKVDIVSLAEARRRLREQEYANRFVCFTLDDGYRDNLEYAYPIFKKQGVPATLFVATSFADKIGLLWWAAIERVIAKTERIAIEVDGKTRFFDCADVAAKQRAYTELYWWLRRMPDEKEMRGIVTDLCERYGVDPLEPCKELCMGWSELETLASDPLITIGAHSVNHYMLKKWPAAVVKQELEQSASVIEKALGKKPVDFAYPVGDCTSADARDFALASEAGYDLAVTTRPGVIFPEHREHLTALPRVSLNGNFQALRYVDVLRSGVPFSLRANFRRLDVA
ncbi:MAG: polysaccharide deacetylase family protein [Xanthobacteraceae bacterium]|nr:polysaccharide deacetylase family protein [Xanthobacteraceae bacterium]MCW5676221.1 polysaccharide deacetylase family protein [Xanthobacteraceae bacterium]